MSDTVLAIIELDRFPEDVAARAAWIAARQDCDLELVLCDPTLAVLRGDFAVSNEAQQIADNIKTAQHRILDDLAGASALRDVAVTTTILEGRPAADAIAARSLEVEPRFVVKGTEHHSQAERARFTYTDWRLIRRLEYPLWLVKPHAWKDHPVFVAAVDPTHEHDAEARLDGVIITTAKQVAATCGASLHLLHTYERLVEIGRHAMFSFRPVKLPIEELETNIRDLHRKKLDALAATHDIDAEAVHQLPGRAHEILPMFVRGMGADLVVMGALARTGSRRRVLGSTAERVLDHLPCDVLIVRA